MRNVPVLRSEMYRLSDSVAYNSLYLDLAIELKTKEDRLIQCYCSGASTATRNFVAGQVAELQQVINDIVDSMEFQKVSYAEFKTYFAKHD